MKTAINLKSYFERAIASAIFAAAIFLFASILWGSIAVYHFELSQTQWLSYDLAKWAWMYPLKHAPFVALSLFASLYGFKKRLYLMDSRHFMVLAFLYSSSLVLIYPHTSDFRGYVAAHFFPYVISLQFGELGLALIWGAVALLVSLLLTFLFSLVVSKMRPDTIEDFKH
jgi:hypothetical protein